MNTCNWVNWISFDPLHLPILLALVDEFYYKMNRQMINVIVIILSVWTAIPGVWFSFSLLLKRACSLSIALIPRSDYM